MESTRGLNPMPQGLHLPMRKQFPGNSFASMLSVPETYRSIEVRSFVRSFALLPTSKHPHQVHEGHKDGTAAGRS